MLIAIDVGNTNVTVGFLKDMSVQHSFKLPAAV